MKLLVCDDDISTIDVIQSQLNLQELGITTLLRAYNGEAAIEIIEKERPELVVCDIGMPKVGGIQVLKYVYESRIYCEFAFLTCYEDFEYARTALRYGARNYLTKPVEFSELNSCLHRMIQSVHEHRLASSGVSDQALLDARRSKLIRQIHEGYYGTDPERIQNALNRTHIADLTAQTLVRGICTISDNTTALQNGWDKETLSYSYGRLSEELLTDYIGFASTVANCSDRYTYATTYVSAENYPEEDCLKRSERFIQMVSANYHLSPVCVVFGPVPLYRISETAVHIREQVKKVLLHGGSIYRLEDLEQIPKDTVPLLDNAQLLRQIKQRNRQEFLETLTLAIHKIAKGKRDDQAMMESVKKSLLQVFYSCLEDNNVPIRDLLQAEDFHSLDQMASRSPTDLMAFATFLFDFAVSELQRKTEETDMIGVVKHYIMEHYKEDIDRNNVAAVAYITPNYLSKRFRAEMGMSLREYINHLRIEEAKRLLLSTNATISEVASAVGYDNISYFSTVFKKICGMSPVEWCGGKRNEEEQP